MNIGRKIYFDIYTGDILVDVSESFGFVEATTIQQDIEIYKVLSERNRETFDFIQLEYGQYLQDFSECNGYKVNLETKEIEFSYPDPNGEEPQVPIYRKSLSVEIAELRQQLNLAQNALDDLILGGM